MANYDRRILVPYLRDVCSVEFLCAKLNREITACQKGIHQLTNGINAKYEDPAPPNKAKYMSKWSVGDIMWGVVGLGVPIALALTVAKWAYSWSPSPLRTIIMIAAISFALILGLCAFFEIRNENKDGYQSYQRALNEYNRICKWNKQQRSQIPALQQRAAVAKSQYNVLLQRYNAAKRLRDEVYSVNVIPSRYRNIHVAYYLYDYFNTSRENDLDKIVQTMLLDEIIQRLDKIIAQNESIILNQRIQQAQQEAANRAMAENHRAQMEQLARMERNQELQHDYQRMIAENQVVTNFFLAADYLYKRR